MITKYFYILSFVFANISSQCIFHHYYKGKSDVIVNCIDDIIVYNSSFHVREWNTFSDKNEKSITKIIENKPPYYYLKNGSLLIKDLSERSTHYMCKVINNITKEVVYQCGTAVTILYPLVLKYVPRNETVDKNTTYTIHCHAGGGDMSTLKLMYFINDKKYEKNDPFQILEDTKIECRVEDGQESLSAIGYITVKREGVLTDKEIFLEKKCGPISKGSCGNIISSTSNIVYNTYSKSEQIVTDLLQQLFYVLDNIIMIEYYEGECVDRFKRLVCSTFYPHCYNDSNVNYGSRPICRESCESVLYLICRNTMATINKHVLNLAQKYTSTLVPVNQVAPSYMTEFVTNLTMLTKSVLDCTRLPSHANKSLHSPCILINIDAKLEVIKKEKSESQCFYETGRNYYGKVNITEKNKTCINWNRIPQLYLAFYQQNLQNQSNYCRNPGGVFKTPICIVSVKKSSEQLRIQDIVQVPCSNIGMCHYLLNRIDISQGSNNNIVAVVLVVAILAIIVMATTFIIRYCQRKVHRSRKKLETTENIPLNDVEFNLYKNKVYKGSQNGGFSFPIYNPAHFEKVQALAVGEYGEIVLVQVVIDNANSINLDESLNSNFDRSGGKHHKPMKNTNESDSTNFYDLILSTDKTFNEKPCWPFDKSSPSGCCPYAVIKYMTNSDTDSKESRFNKETKILSQLNHPNILRFYGVCVHISAKLNCRIVEYLPNGDIKSILTGRRRQPPKLTNHENNNKLKNGYQSVNALKKNRNLKPDDLNHTPDELKLFKRKNNFSTHSRENERPQPTEDIDLTIKQLVKWGIEICDAVLYMHTKHLIHRDIATRNCLVGTNLEAKLADFSFVQKFSYGFDLIGNPNEYIPIRWLPKETLEDVIYNTDTDVWMFGVYLWELMSLGKVPYNEYDLNEVYDAIISDKKLQQPENCPIEVYKQMELCFSPPRQRPCLEIVKNNLIKFINNV